MLLDGNTVHPLPRMVLDQLLKEGRIKVGSRATSSTDPRTGESYRLIQAATPLDLQRALRTQEEIRPFLDGTATKPASRTQRRNLCKWRSAEASFGNGFLGILPRFAKCGNRTARLEKSALEIVRNQTDAHYANPKKVRKLRVYERIAELCRTGGHQVPSYGWYCKYLKTRISYDLLVAREGRRAAYRLEPRAEQSEEYVSHRATRAFAKAYVDHTQTDVEVRCSVTSNPLGRPWLTTIVCDYSADILGSYLTFDPPSYRSILMAMRNCVALHGRLPESLVVDGGKEFRGIWFETTAAYFRVTILRRPSAKSRFGSRGERTFGTINSTFLHTLLGNTQLRKNVRQMSPEVDPNEFSVWTFEALLAALEKYFDQYRNLVHREVLSTSTRVMLYGVLSS